MGEHEALDGVAAHGTQDVGLGDGFDSFVTDADSAAVVHALQHWLGQSDPVIFYLHGPSGSGRSHLLQAAAQRAGGLYLPLRVLVAVEPAAVCDGLELVPLLALDDLDAVSVDPRWAEALFHLFNRAVAAGHRWALIGGGNHEAAGRDACGSKIRRRS